MGKLKPCNAEDHDTKRLCKDRYGCARFIKNQKEHTSISFYHLQEHCTSFKRDEPEEVTIHRSLSFEEKLSHLQSLWKASQED